MNTGTLGVSAEEGLDISGVLYNYTTVKNVVDDFTVTIENDKVGGGYVFKTQKIGLVSMVENTECYTFTLHTNRAVW
jgi:hypothetical protein